MLLGNIQQSIKRLDPIANSGNHEIVPEGAVRLLIRTDGDTEVVHVLGRKTTIGRTPDNDLQIDAKFISRHHAVILAGPNYTIIEDLNSTNGVLVNNRRVTRHTLQGWRQRGDRQDARSASRCVPRLGAAIQIGLSIAAVHAIHLASRHVPCGGEPRVADSPTARCRSDTARARAAVPRQMRSIGGGSCSLALQARQQLIHHPVRNLLALARDRRSRTSRRCVSSTRQCAPKRRSSRCPVELRGRARGAGAGCPRRRSARAP